MLFKFIKDSYWLQTLYVKISAAIHPMICHNIGKLEMIKASLHFASIEQVEGSYFEFGVFEGTSLLSAARNHNTIISKNSIPFYKDVYDRKFYGFDSFDGGFKYSEDIDRHPFFKEGDFASSYERCKKRLKPYDNVELIKGYFEDTIADKKCSEMFDGEKCAIVFIDCDLLHSSYLALEFVLSSLVEGSIIILDDYFAYKGNPEKGVCGAWNRFLSEHSEIKTQQFHQYGYTGMSFIVQDIGTS